MRGPNTRNVESKHGEINASHNGRDAGGGAGQSISEMSVALLFAYTTQKHLAMELANIYLMYPNNKLRKTAE